MTADRPEPRFYTVTDAEPGYADGFKDGYLSGWSEAFDWMAAREASDQ